MASVQKQDRFKKITAARAKKINDMLRLIGNCANKNNYSYSDAEVLEIFREIEENLNEAKQKYEVFHRENPKDEFKAEFERGFTWIEGFMRNVRRAPDKKAVICPDTGEIWSYSELNCEINKCANAMLELGVKRGDRVMYQMGNCPEFVFIYAACQKIGAVGCPIGAGISPMHAASIINFTEPAVFFYENNGDTELAVNMAAHKPTLVVMDFPHNKRVLSGHITYEQMTRGSSEGNPKTALSPNIYDETTLFYTSGTSGCQKCVPVTSINEALSAHDVMQQLSVNTEDIMLTLAPWSHRGGLHCGGPATALYAGATLISLNDLSPEACLEYAEKYKISLISGSPTDFRALANVQEKNEKNLAALKRIISVGSILSKEECTRLKRYISPNVYNGYGTTETFWNTILTPRQQLFFAGTVGTPCVTDEVRIVKLYDDHDARPDELVPYDGETQGEIIIKALSKSAGYYKSNPGEGGSRYYEGYLYTRDVGTWDKEGIITVAGRNDDMIICGGEKIYPNEIENFLCRNPKVADCIVTSAADKNGEDSIIAYVVKADRTLEAEELDRYCLESRELSDNIRPRFYRFKKVLPKTDNGKKQHKKAKQMALNDMKKGMLTHV